jgi:TolB-like protein/cytochrome c-type biogenesis protein CcmH/NrfG
VADTRPAVFLSYASEDAAVAARICAALRAAGVEVWFDQSELRGGDAWDAAIRRQIKSCGLFIPIISRHSHDRAEGYFRLEWKLAVDRSHLIAPDRPFLVPVVVDDTRDDDPRVPDRFRELQWTALPGGETPPSFVERIARLLAPELPTATAVAVGSSPGTVTRPETAATAPTAAQPDAARRMRLRRALLAAAAIIVLGVAYLAIQRYVGSSRQPGPLATNAPAAATSPPLATQKSIAVLPFLDMSEKHDQEYFSDGLTEELLDQLAQVPDLRVPARTSSFYFKGKQATIAEIARALGVAHVLEGSVRKSGNTVRVTAQLIQADNGYHLWSSTYDRDVKDIFKVQDQIAAAVVDALKAKLLPAASTLNARRTENSEAYNQYLIGRQFMARGNSKDLPSAAAAFRRSIALDPNFAAAWAGLADAMYWTGDTEFTVAKILADRKESRAAADKAVALQPGLAYAYVVRAIARFDDPDFAGARADLQRAYALEPENADVLLSYANMALSPVGDLQQAIAVQRKAAQLDPLNARIWSFLALMQQAAGDFDGAAASANRSLEISPVQTYTPIILATNLVLQRRPAEALVAAQRSTLNGLRQFGVALALGDLPGRESEARQSLAKLIEVGSESLAYQIALVYAWRGQRDQAIHWLERARDNKDAGLIWLRIDPLLVKLHGDPRYEAMLVAAQLK